MIRRLFLAMSVRERTLLALFIWVILLVWLFDLVDDTRARLAQNHELAQRLKTQQLLLDQAEAADQALASARENVDADSTYTASQLVGELDRIARAAGVTADISSTSTQETDLFSFHNVRLRIRKARINDLIAFDNEIKKLAPYITLTEFQISSDKRDPRNLDATFKAESFELKTSALGQ